MKQNRQSILSPRQRQCLEGVAAHLDSTQIGERLGISPHTVDKHIAAAVAALGARSRRDAVRIWRDIASSCNATGEKLTGDFPPVDFPPPEPADRSRSMVKEIDDQSSFVIGPDRPIDRQGGKDEQAKRTLVRLAILIGITAALAIILVALPVLGHGAQSLANLIQPYRPNH